MDEDDIFAQLANINLDNAPVVTAPQEQQQIENVVEEINYINSPTLCQAADSSQRFKGADWFDIMKHTTVSIIGAGGIGSWTIYAFARANVGCMVVYDGDTVSSTNMAGQLYRLSDVGKPKVSALYDICKDYVPTVNMIGHNNFYNNQPLTPITITALDSMTARKLVYENWKKQFSNVKEEDKWKYLFVDGRMSAENFQIFCFRLSDKESMKIYEEEALFDSSKATPAPCTFRATTFVGMGIGGNIFALVKNHVYLANRGSLFKDNVELYNEYDSTMGIKLIKNKEFKL